MKRLAMGVAVVVMEGGNKPAPWWALRHASLDCYIGVTSRSPSLLFWPNSTPTFSGMKI